MFQVMMGLVIAVLSFSASAQEMSPENLPATSAQDVEMGRGFVFSTGEITIGDCAEGSVGGSDSNVSFEAFAEPYFYEASPGQITVMFLAISSRVRSTRLNGTTFRSEPACGTHYVDSLTLGGKISFSFKFWAEPANHDNLRKYLHSKITDLRSVYHLNYAETGFAIYPDFFTFGHGRSETLKQLADDCHGFGRSCDALVDQAILDSKNIPMHSKDNKYDVISFTVEAYDQE